MGQQNKHGTLIRQGLCVRCEKPSKKAICSDCVFERDFGGKRAKKHSPKYCELCNKEIPYYSLSERCDKCQGNGQSGCIPWYYNMPYQARRDLGLCVRCLKPSLKNAECDTCRIRHNAQNVKRYHRLKGEGRCPCGALLDPDADMGRVYCINCREKINSLQRGEVHDIFANNQQS